MKKEKKTRIHHLGRKVGVVVACLLILSIGIVVQVCVAEFRDLTVSILEYQCVSGTNMLAYEMAEHPEGGDMTQVLDDLKEQTGNEYTIFEGDTRAYTTIMQDGERAVGTQLSEELQDLILVQGQSYVGSAEILGKEHLCSYVPTKDANGEITGLIFAGVSIEDANREIDKTVTKSMAVGAALIVVGILILAAYMRNAVSKPLSKLTSLAQTMEQGDMGLHGGQKKMNIRSNDEVGFLARTFEQTMDRMSRYIGELSNVLAEIAGGNLSVETTQDYVGDFVSIKESLDGILARLNSTMSQIIESSDYVTNGAEQMAIGATALSQGAVEQASSVEDLDSNIERISEQVEVTAGNAATANEKVEKVEEQILECNQKMQEMINAMQEINDRSNEIGKIIKTIENISAQTNILALNASVEATRAGEAGKGFAVVAGEVRELAAKSAEASQTTTTLIERSVVAVEHGTKIANETAKQLESVVSGAGDIVDVTNGIAEAARAGADAVLQVREQIRQISSVVQTNSATAQESAATSQQLSQQAGILKELMRVFHLSRKK